MRAKTTKAKPLTVADIRKIVRDEVALVMITWREQGLFGQPIKTEAVGKEPLVMTGEPPKSNFTVPVRPSYLANMVKTGLKSPTLQ